MRPQPLIAVTDVEASSQWYQRLLGCESAHGGRKYERLIANGVLILQLHTAWLSGSVVGAWSWSLKTSRPSTCPMALLSGCVGFQGPLMRQPYLFRRDVREQIQAEDMDLHVGVIDAMSAGLELRVQVSDDHSIAAADGSVAALLAAEHLELWTRAPGDNR